MINRGMDINKRNKCRFISLEKRPKKNQLLQNDARRDMHTRRKIAIVKKWHSPIGLELFLRKLIAFSMIALVKRGDVNNCFDLEIYF